MAALVQAREASSSISLFYKWRGRPPFSSQAFNPKLTYKLMGGSQSSVSFCGLFNASSNKKNRYGSESEYEGDDAQRKVWPSDEFEEEKAGIRGRWVGEVDVDSKASAFIAKFHQTRIMLSDQIEASLED